MKKEDVIKAILSVCKSLDLSVKTKVKTLNWKADVVVDYEKYKVAFNIGKCPVKVAETYQAMRKERVCGCWLILDSKRTSYTYEELPCFPMYDDIDNEVKVVLANVWDEEKTLLLSDFISSIIRGKIRYVSSTSIKYVDVRFYKKHCWKCNREFDAYFVYKTISESGIEIAGGIDSLDPKLVKGIQRFIRNHPERKIVLGQIKQRFSQTVEDSYMSFGCPHCDSIYGAHYQNDDYMELIYSVEELPSAIIELDESISVQTNSWYKIE